MSSYSLTCLPSYLPLHPSHQSHHSTYFLLAQDMCLYNNYWDTRTIAGDRRTYNTVLCNNVSLSFSLLMHVVRCRLGDVLTWLVWCSKRHFPRTEEFTTNLQRTKASDNNQLVQLSLGLVAVTTSQNNGIRSWTQIYKILLEADISFPERKLLRRARPLINCVAMSVKIFFLFSCVILMSRAKLTMCGQ